jgi:hypothetical protein
VLRRFGFVAGSAACREDVWARKAWISVDQPEPFACWSKRRHDHDIDPRPIDEEQSLQKPLFPESDSPIDVDRPDIIAKYDQSKSFQVQMIPTIVPANRQRFFAISLSAMSFFSDADADVSGAVHGADILDMDIANDLWISALADRQHDASGIPSSLAPTDKVLQIYRPEGAVEPSRGDVISPTVHRGVIVRNERADGNLISEEHPRSLSLRVRRTACGRNEGPKLGEERSEKGIKFAPAPHRIRVDRLSNLDRARSADRSPGSMKIEATIVPREATMGNDTSRYTLQIGDKLLVAHV